MITIKCVLTSQRTKFICNRYVRLSHVANKPCAIPLRRECQLLLFYQPRGRGQVNSSKNRFFLNTPQISGKSEKTLDGTSIVIKGSYEKAYAQPVNPSHSGGERPKPEAGLKSTQIHMLCPCFRQSTQVGFRSTAVDSSNALHALLTSRVDGSPCAAQPSPALADCSSRLLNQAWSRSKMGQSLAQSPRVATRWLCAFQDALCVAQNRL